ncbi:RNA polymerase-associated protein RTF1 [Pleurostoma richardsiae]|uniref:RNA polymerase-associated protein RTF1 n=1 Tax=Pleurostoma richardsiae TaxID=41990 RepID=A0AA38VK68_9PEZI|nr:RNA polymerase-associated protein RTF1 [Pleurostoma richardsiae]
MSDIDDELLALAGGDVSSDEDEGSLNISREESRSPAPPKKKDAPAKGVATKKPAAKKAKKRVQDDSEEEGEASSAPSSPSSHGSAPMDESDSDSDAPPRKSREDDDNKYPIEGLFMSLAEKEEIMSMREVDREQILAERAQEKERLRQNALLRQLVTNQENEEKKQRKRTASTADLEESQRKSSRVRTKIGGTRAGEASSALDTLRRARAEKNDRMRRREENDRRKERSPSFGASDRDADRESSVEWGGATKLKSRSPEVKEIPPAELRDVERIRVGRTRFAEVCFHPGFEKAIVDCYARISIGPDPNTRENVYRMAVIKGFTKGKPYAIETRTGKQIVTDQYATAAHGKSVRDWPFVMCSDSPFTESEWNRYCKTLQAEGLALPKKPALANKIEDINELIGRSWTDVEVTERLNKIQKLRDRFSGVERDRLEAQIEKAKAFGNEDRVSKLQEELDKLEVPRLAFRTSLTPRKSTTQPGTPSQQDRLAELNRENRRKNTEAVRKAQLKERAKVRDVEARLARGEQVEEDTSRRLKTTAKFVHDVHEPVSSQRTNGASQNGSGASTPANGTPRTGPLKQAALPHLAKLQQAKAVDKNGLPTIHKPLMDDDIIGALDLDIDIEID